MKLGYNHTFRTVDDECCLIRHVRNRTEEHVLNDRVKIFVVGVNSLYGAEQEKVFPALQLSEVRLRVAVRAGKKEDAEVIGREIEALYVNGPAGGGGARSSVESVLSIASVLIPEEDVHPTVCWERGE